MNVQRQRQKITFEDEDERKKPRSTKTKKVQAKLDSVLSEVSKAREALKNGMGEGTVGKDEVVKDVQLILEKATIIGEDGDLQAWYSEKLGV